MNYSSKPRYSVLLPFVSITIALNHFLLAEAAIVTGQVKRYNPNTRQATISLGSQQGIGTYDSGQIELALQGQSRGGFIDAAVEVIEVNANTSVVQVQEKSGVEVPIQVGARVLMETGSGEQARQTITQQCLTTGSANQLPRAYTEAYCLTFAQPSPETYYSFAAIQLEYDQPDNTLRWLADAEAKFPDTKPINDIYEAVALTDLNRPQQGLDLLESVNLQERGLKQEVKSYILTNLGDWDAVITLAQESPSSATWNNRLIAQYCQSPPELERETEVLPNTCPVALGYSFEEPSERGRETIERLSEEAARRYPRDPHMLNTLGFLSLQLEDYSRAYAYYQQLAQLLNRVDESNTPPHVLELKANAIRYLNNYNQNYAFLNNRRADLTLLQAQQRQITVFSGIEGLERSINRASRGQGLANVLGSIFATGAEMTISEINAARIRGERKEILDQMRLTFTQGIIYIAARPDLEIKQLQREVIALR